MTEMNATMMENATATLSENSSKEQTIRFDLVEQLARKMCISLEDARNALEAADWNMLTATHMLEQEAFCRKQALNDAAEQCAVNDNAAQASATAGKAAAFGKDTRDSAAAKKKATAKHKKWFSNLCDHLRRLLTYGNRNRFTIFKDGEQLLEMPVTALALLLLFSFGTCALLMLVGLFTGCRYNITNAVEA